MVTPKEIGQRPSFQNQSKVLDDLIYLLYFCSKESVWTLSASPHLKCCPRLWPVATACSETHNGKDCVSITPILNGVICGFSKKSAIYLPDQF